jgi:1-deoxy-D-xylulose-5-phosphate synthase
LQNAPVVLAVDRAGVVGEDGPTHHGIFDISFFRTIPNLTLMAPKDENELRHMIYSAFSYQQPVAVRYPRSAGLGVEMDNKMQLIEKGKAELLRDGKDLTLIGFGPVVYRCLQAAEKLKTMGIDAAVINLRFVNPLDEHLIISLAKKTGKIVTVEDHILNGGAGSAVLEVLQSKGLTDIIVERIGYKHYVEHGSTAVLHQVYGINSEQIVETALKLAGRDKREGLASG